MYCHKCGTELPSDANFCAKCGTKTVRVKSTGVERQMAVVGAVGSDTHTEEQQTLLTDDLINLEAMRERGTLTDGEFQGAKAKALGSSQSPNVHVPVTSASTLDGGIFDFDKLVRGDYGLAKTYWLYGVLVNIIASIVSKIVFSMITSPPVALLAALAGVVVSAAYYVVVMLGIWRAAATYTGPKIWGILAKFASAFGGLIIAVTLFGVIRLVAAT